MANQTLKEAKRAKKDEFYTCYDDINEELRHYKELFRGKTVLLNCDDPYESNFFKYFCLNFNHLGLKRLTATCYSGSPVTGREYRPQELGLEFADEPQTEAATAEAAGQRVCRTAYCAEVNYLKDMNADLREDMLDIEIILREEKNSIRLLHGDERYGAGDFRSLECVELLREADIVVTNPPFSLFREYVALLVKYDKRFLIIGNQNAITYKEIFPLIKENKMWLGYGFKGGASHFINHHYVDYATAGDHKEGMIRVSGVVWFTNLETDKRHEPLRLGRKYAEADYPRYDNYDAIEVSKTIDIPADYYGVMGVPITFLDKYCPDQFEIIWQASGNTRKCAPPDVLEELKYVQNKEDRGGCPVLKGKRTYSRILIRRLSTDNNQ